MLRMIAGSLESRIATRPKSLARPKPRACVAGTLVIVSLITGLCRWWTLALKLACHRRRGRKPLLGRSKGIPIRPRRAHRYDAMKRLWGVNDIPLLLWA